MVWLSGVRGRTFRRQNRWNSAGQMPRRRAAGTQCAPCPHICSTFEKPDPKLRKTQDEMNNVWKNVSIKKQMQGKGTEKNFHSFMTAASGNLPVPLRAGKTCILVQSFLHFFLL